MILPNGDYTLYYFGMYEEDYSVGAVQTGTTLCYPAGGAMRVTTESPHTDNLYFVLTDQLGSTSVVTDYKDASTAGVEVGRMGYYPFGENRYYNPGFFRGSTGSLYTDKLYTGQQQVAGIGLPAPRSHAGYNYKARF